MRQNFSRRALVDVSVTRTIYVVSAESRSMNLPAVSRALAALLFLVVAALPVRADDGGQAILHLLDYVAGEYPQWVKGGVVLNESEYAEQVEFSENAKGLIAKLGANPERDQLVAAAEALAAAVRDKQDGTQVAGLANRLKMSLIGAYKLEVTPRKLPDLSMAPALYASRCASCHGADGRGDGPAAASLDPKPSNFRDAVRLGRRSVYSLYSTITLGVDGTSMAAHADLSDEQRWALAFSVSNLASDPSVTANGAKLWTAGEGRAAFRNLTDLVLATASDIQSRDGDNGAAVLAYLRANPQAVQTAASPLDFAMQALGESLSAFRGGDAKAAYELAVSAYLEGFELVEGRLEGIERGLKGRVEEKMIGFRNTIKTGGSIATLETQHRELIEILGDAKARMAGGEVSPQAQFVSSLVIILREGLEAILVLAGMAAFLKRTGRAGGLPYLHGGWIAAIALGVFTWWVATALIEVSGAQREVTEGVTALVAAAMLLYVGFWLHSRVSGQRWNAFIKNQVNGALGKGTLWGLTAISFLAVYREVFETVLFYQALIAQGGAVPVLAGFGVGCVILVALAVLIIRFSAKLPLGLFFGISSVLLAAMAVIFAGQGIAALQAAGRVPSDPVNGPTLPLLGIYPNAQGLLLQLGLVVFIVAAYLYTNRASPKPPKPA